MKIYNRTFEGTISVDNATDFILFTLDLSVYSERYLMVETKTDIVDTIGGSTGAYLYDVQSIYNVASATVQSNVYGQDVNFKKSNTPKSSIKKPVYIQSTQQFRNEINSVDTTTRDVRYKSYIKIIAF